MVKAVTRCCCDGTDGDAGIGAHGQSLLESQEAQVSVSKPPLGWDSTGMGDNICDGVHSHF